jgi:hypothetical protein
MSAPRELPGGVREQDSQDAEDNGSEVEGDADGVAS